MLTRSLRDRAVDDVIALGPLTNVAALLAESRELFQGVRVIWMGGTLGPGNASALAEFNCFADPAAVAAVIDSGVDLQVVGLEVTQQVRVLPDQLEPGCLGDSGMGRLLEAVLDSLMDAEEPILGERMAVLHDPAAVFSALDADWFRFEPRTLQVRVEEGHERGRLVETSAAHARQVRYATEVREDVLATEFVKRLAGWAPGVGP